MVKTAELEQGLNNLFGGLLASKSKEAQENPVYKYLVQHPEIFKTPSDFNFHVLHKIEDAIEEAVKTVKSGNYEYINIFTDFQFYENHIEKLCTHFEGGACCADKSSVIVQRYLNFLATGDKGKWEVGKEVFIEKIKENVRCYWLPNFGTQDQWFDLMHGLFCFRYGNPENYLKAYQALLVAGKALKGNADEQ
ncbi:hypothetical protein QDS01_18285 [Acinetobacter nosocomialis]|uniref:hypothetical protein n=1 Tax=Acinetobacter nosocomialis TaxID=106654 RepID=UPI00244B350F|nr:hypothetical protein [Acinetobacter nosocomialis]MDH2636862.1 hypothetical protein [Acinetobacter nosocomialis]